jgi:hypothetical protein
LRRQKIPHQIQKAWAVKIKNALGVKKWELRVAQLED